MAPYIQKKKKMEKKNNNKNKKKTKTNKNKTKKKKRKEMAVFSVNKLQKTSTRQKCTTVPVHMKQYIVHSLKEAL